MANLGRITRVEPIRLPQHIISIKKLLTRSPRNLALFTFGINTALRASDLLRIKLSDVEHLNPGEHFVIREKKTGKTRLKCQKANQIRCTAVSIKKRCSRSR